MKEIDKEDYPESARQLTKDIICAKYVGFLPPNRLGSGKMMLMENFLRLSPRLASGGSPTLEELEELRDAGCEVVINLALPTSNNAIPAEGDHVRRMGMQYIPIPVAWENPTRQNMLDFFTALDDNRERSVFVHCVKNMRVSAFIYLYRVLRLGIASETAYVDMAAIWEPEGVWDEFIRSMLDTGK